MQARVVHSILIAAPPAEVFKYMADLQYHPLWNPSLQKVAPVKPLEEGMHYKSYNWMFNMKLTGTVLVQKLEKSKRLELRSVAGMIEYLVTYRLARQEGGTLVTCRTTVSTESKAFAFAKPMMHLLAQRELHSDLEALKQLVEKGTAQQT